MNGNLEVSNKIIQDDVRNTDQSEMDTGPTENSAEVHMTRQRKKKRNSKTMINVEVQREVDTGSTENLAEGNVTIEKPKIRENVQSIGLTEMGMGSTEVHANGNVIIKNPKVRNDIQQMDQTETDTGPTEISAEVHVSRKRKKKRKREPKIDVEVQREVDTGSIENLAEVNVTIEKPNNREEDVQSIGQTSMAIRLTEKLAEGNVMIIKNPKIQDDVQRMDQSEIGTGPTENSAEVHVTRKRKKKRKSKANINVEIQRGLNTQIRRKLLVLDVNGLLADIIFSAKNVHRGGTRILGRVVYKRPFCDDFLKFCFQNFDVGIWSSRSKKIIKAVVTFLLGDQKNKLLFCWDMDRATKTRFNSLENRHKPLVFKELRKIWENDDCNFPWKKKDYDESNTLLLDDSPYKALLNPMHTAVFPNPYQHNNKNDDSLGPGGDLRVYLEGLVTAENVQKYVEQHPFGQRPITKEHCSWEFYSRVLHQVSNAVKRTTSIPKPVEGKSSTPIPVEGKSSTPIPVEGKSLTPIPVEGKSSTPILVEGKSSKPIPVEGKSSTPIPVKGRDVKRVKAQLSSPIKRKREKVNATFLWPV